MPAHTLQAKVYDRLVSMRARVAAGGTVPGGLSVADLDRLAGDLQVWNEQCDMRV